MWEEPHALPRPSLDARDLRSVERYAYDAGRAPLVFHRGRYAPGLP